jgi:20S proteasome subunit alpha 4
LQSLEQAEIEAIVAGIEQEKEAEAERKRARLAATQAGQASMFASTLSGAATPATAGAPGATVPGEESGVQ